MDDEQQELAHQQELEQQEQSEMNIYQKLNEARKQFHALKLKKTGHNKFAGYDYFELGDFLIPGMDCLRGVGLCAIVSFLQDVATLRLIDVETPNDEIRFTSPMGSAALKGCHEVQNIGAVETYQRRYLWVAALEIVEHDALDSSEPVEKDKSDPTLNMPELVRLITHAQTLDILKDVFAKAYPVASAAQKRVLKTNYDKRKAALEPATEENPFEGVTA